MSGQLILKPVGESSIEPVTLDRGQAATIGRALESDVCLPDESVSRRHAGIEWREAAWFVTDLGSTQGTRLSGQQIEAHKPVILRDGDSLQIGRHTLHVTLTEEAPPDSVQGQRSSQWRIRIGDLVQAATDKPHRAPQPAANKYSTRASIFLRLRDDQTLVRELSWEEFRQRYAPVIVGFARNQGVAAQDADDVLQDVLLAFFQVSPRFEYDPSKGRFRGYLKRITRQAVAELWRRAGRAGTPAEDLDNQDSPQLDEVWGQLWSEQIFQRAIDEAHQRFEPRTMEAFDLFARRGVPAEAVAERLGMSVNSVHHAKSRVMKVVGEIVERIRAEEG